MESKTYLFTLFTCSTISILIGIFFIGSFTSTQQYKQFEVNQLSQIERFNNSTTVHKYLFDNITQLKKGLDPILANIPNATEMKIRQDTHYNQTAEDFETIKRLLEIKIEDHNTLGQVNQTVNEILDILKGNEVGNNNGTIQPVPPVLPLANK